jgi:succinoglycan biosynthesis protein ExoO
MEDRTAQGPPSPRVTLLMANYNGGAHIEAAIRSALRQTVADLEVVVVDDASSDDSLTIVQRLAAEDARLRWASLERNSGPAAARNLGLELARGRWVAILDSDDLIHSQRIEWLIAEAIRHDADIVADDLLVFHDDGEQKPKRFLKGSRARRPGWVLAADYIRSASLYASRPNLGFLKPLIDLQALRGLGLRYDESLRIGEDSELIARGLLAGLRMRTTPFPAYLYRKHPASTSHRLRTGDVEAMIGASARLAQRATAPEDRRALSAYRRSLRRALAFGRMIDFMRARRWRDAASAAAQDASSVWLLWMPVHARLERLFKRLAHRGARAPARPSICVVSRQRLVGPANGSSAYLLALCRALRGAGFELSLVQPTPAVFGRVPILVLRPEMRVFARHSMRGALRAGNLVICLRPSVWVAAARGVAARLLQRVGLPHGFLRAERAAYSAAAPWTAADAVYLARRAGGPHRAVVTDYAFQNVMLPYVLGGAPLSVVVTHDLFCRRTEQFQALRHDDGVASLSEPEEMALLDLADIVVAIQEDEAAFIRARSDRAVVVAPMGERAVAHASAGTSEELLFVGSNTSPNVIAVRWLFEEVWPRIRAARTHATLTIVGAVADAFVEAPPPGARFLGRVRSLDPIYLRAAVVVSPLTVGTGLKIKLIEAMARGKAIVATPTTLQGVEEIAGSAVRVAADAAAFTAAAVDLLSDPTERLRLGAAALEVARAHFSEAGAAAELLKALA